MHELTGQALYSALAYANSVDEEAGRDIIGQFQLNQPVLAETVFNIFPAVVAEQNMAMSDLFMDLCFDILCVYEKAFGPLPTQHEMGVGWLEKQAMLLDAELQALARDKAMDARLRSRLQDRLLQRATKETLQMPLVNYLYAVVDDYASENASRVPAIKTTQVMVFIVIRLFSGLYSHAAKGQASRPVPA